MRLIVGYIYTDPGSDDVFYCLDDVPDPDVGELVDLGELEPGREYRCVVCGRDPKEATCES